VTRISADALARLDTTLVFSDPALTTADTAWSQHLPFAFWLAEALRPETFVELGVHTGVSYCAFCQAIAELALPAAAYGVDTWQGDPHAGDYDDAVFDRLHAHHDPLYGGFSQLMRTTFDAAHEHFAPRSVDLLHIDGLHTYDAVRHDFETWLPALSTRGVVLLHDITVRERDFGVWRLWQELREHYPSFAFPFGHGLGVLGVGDDLPEALRWLLLQDGRHDDHEAVVRFFSLLGDRLEARAGMTRAMRACAQEKEKRANDIATLQGTQEELAACHGELAACRGELAACHSELEVQREEVAAIAGSVSWRVTAPLRMATRTVRRIAGTTPPRALP
jgi:O-antigen biosynthesis protein